MEYKRDYAAWMKNYKLLGEYKKKHGHTRVPKRYEHHHNVVVVNYNNNNNNVQQQQQQQQVATTTTPLGTWVAYQRRLKRSNKLLPERQALLNDLGFVWKVDKHAQQQERDDQKWQEHFEQLQNYWSQHGMHYPIIISSASTCTTGDDDDDEGDQEKRQLKNWVERQRREFRNGTLRPDRQKKLEDFGFVWEIYQKDDERTMRKPRNDDDAAQLTAPYRVFGNWLDDFVVEKDRLPYRLKIEINDRKSMDYHARLQGDGFQKRKEVMALTKEMLKEDSTFDLAVWVSRADNHDKKTRKKS